MASAALVGAHACAGTDDCELEPWLEHTAHPLFYHARLFVSLQ